MCSTALITGASAGIGEQFSQVLAENGFNLILVARSADRLEKLAAHLEHQYQISCRVLVADLRQAAARELLYKQLQLDKINIDVLINNAGFGEVGYFFQQDPTQHQDMIDLNVSAVVHLCRLFAPSMVQQAKGKILNVASMAAFQPGPYMANYYATKAYVLSFSEALAEELKPHGVQVSVLCPGPTKSEFFSRANISDSLLDKPFVMHPKRVARVGYKGLMRGQLVVVPGKLNQLLVSLSKLTPNFILRPLMAYGHKAFRRQ